MKFLSIRHAVLFASVFCMQMHLKAMLPPRPPSNFTGVIQPSTDFFNCGGSCEFVLTATFTPSTDLSITDYQIYSNGLLIADIPASGPYILELCAATVADLCNDNLILYSNNVRGLSTPVPLVITSIPEPLAINNCGSTCPTSCVQQLP
jgi:hypothetical protein